MEEFLRKHAGERTQFDLWIESRFHTLTRQVLTNMDNYDITRTVREIQNFVIEDLSNWYVRNNRRRYWAEGDDPSGDGEVPWVSIVFPGEGDEVDNPVTFQFEGGGGVVSVSLEAEGWALTTEPVALSVGTYTYSFTGVNYERHVLLTGLDADGFPVASDEVRFTPVQVPCSIPDQPGFKGRACGRTG